LEANHGHPSRLIVSGTAFMRQGLMVRESAVAPMPICQKSGIFDGEIEIEKKGGGQRYGDSTGILVDQPTHLNASCLLTMWLDTSARLVASP
jgi:hypothetical protein